VVVCLPFSAGPSLFSWNRYLIQVLGGSLFSHPSRPCRFFFLPGLPPLGFPSGQSSAGDRVFELVLRHDCSDIGDVFFQGQIGPFTPSSLVAEIFPGGSPPPESSELSRPNRPSRAGTGALLPSSFSPLTAASPDVLIHKKEICVSPPPPVEEVPFLKKPHCWY